MSWDHREYVLERINIQFQNISFNYHNDYPYFPEEIVTQTMYFPKLPQDSKCKEVISVHLFNQYNVSN